MAFPWTDAVMRWLTVPSSIYLRHFLGIPRPVGVLAVSDIGIRWLLVRVVGRRLAGLGIGGAMCSDWLRHWSRIGLVYRFRRVQRLEI